MQRVGEDMFGAVKASKDPAAIRLLEAGGAGCAKRKNAEEMYLKLKDEAARCKTKAE